MGTLNTPNSPSQPEPTTSTPSPDASTTTPLSSSEVRVGQLDTRVLREFLANGIRYVQGVEFREQLDPSLRPNESSPRNIEPSLSTNQFSTRAPDPTVRIAVPGTLVNATQPITIPVNLANSRASPEGPSFQQKESSTPRFSPVVSETKWGTPETKLNTPETKPTPPDAKPVASEIKVEPQKTSEPRAETIAVDVSHKNIAQALESALEKVLKGSSTTPELKITIEPPRTLVTQTDVAPQHTPVVNADKVSAGPSKAPDAPQSASPEPVSASPSTVPPAKITDPIVPMTPEGVSLHITPQPTNSSQPTQPTQATLVVAPLSTPLTPELAVVPQQAQVNVTHSLQQPPTAHQDPAPHAQEHGQTRPQKLDHVENQRATNVRMIQQIVASEREPNPIQTSASLVASASYAADTALSSHPRYQSTTVAMDKLRDSLLDKFTAIQTQIETHSTERQRTTPETPSASSLIQGRSNAVKVDPIIHDLRPSLNLRHGDRTSENGSLYRSVVQGSYPVQNNPFSSVVTQSHLERFAAPLLSLGDLLKRLQAFSQRSNNVQLMKRMDSSLERVCLALVTGAALGVVGAEMLIKTLHQGIRQILCATEECADPEQDSTQQTLEFALAHALEQTLVNDALQPSARSIVADVSGRLIDTSSGEPVSHVLVGSKELGSTITDGEGRFLFSNIRIGTPYVLAFYKPFFNVVPGTVTGQCGPDSHHQIDVALNQITS